MKKWQTIGVTALSTLALSIGGFTTYQYLQPTHYQGEVFNNEKTKQTINEKTKQTSNDSFSSEQQQSKQSSTSTTSAEQFQSRVDTSAVPEYYKVMNQQEFSSTYHPQLGGTNMSTVIAIPVYNGYAIVNTINPIDAIIVETTDNYTIAHLRMQEAKDFANWVNSIAQYKPLQHSLYDNLQYYFNNVK